MDHRPNPRRLRWNRALSGCCARGSASDISEAGPQSTRATARWAVPEAVPVDGTFRIGSVTTMFVDTVVLQLVSEGHLGLDDPVADHLPQYDLAVSARHRPRPSTRAIRRSSPPT
ncbi:serine hydrolase [Nocardia sp. NPDC060249]|uniref:serine hydrolase n=1 Tax=Nocardia sp. NPDC060249 TaxID=3347082 RepID=UPI00366049AB